MKIDENTKLGDLMIELRRVGVATLLICLDTSDVVALHATLGFGVEPTTYAAGIGAETFDVLARRAELTVAESLGVIRKEPSGG